MRELRGLTRIILTNPQKYSRNKHGLRDITFFYFAENVKCYLTILYRDVEYIYIHGKELLPPIH